MVSNFCGGNRDAKWIIVTASRDKQAKGTVVDNAFFCALSTSSQHEIARGEVDGIRDGKSPACVAEGANKNSLRLADKRADQKTFICIRKMFSAQPC